MLSLAGSETFAQEAKKSPAPEKTDVYLFTAAGYATLSGSVILRRITCHGSNGTCWGIGSDNGHVYIDIFNFEGFMQSFWLSAAPRREPDDPDGSTNWSIDVIGEKE